MLGHSKLCRVLPSSVLRRDKLIFDGFIYLFVAQSRDENPHLPGLPTIHRYGDVGHQKLRHGVIKESLKQHSCTRFRQESASGKTTMSTKWTSDDEAMSADGIGSPRILSSPPSEQKIGSGGGSGRRPRRSRPGDSPAKPSNGGKEDPPIRTMAGG